MSYDTVIEVLPSDRKHGVADGDIHHAVANALSVDDVGEDPLRYLLVGPGCDGGLLEVVVMDRAAGPCVIHAMKMRNQYQRLLPRTGE